MQLIKSKARIFIRHLIQATAACLTMMVQGNFLDLTPEHWGIALTTGTGAGFLAILFSFKPFTKWVGNMWHGAATAFVATFAADIWVHPTHFGSPITEALYTGLGAALISLLISYTADKK